MSKGSSPRPFDVDHETYSNNFDAIFGKKKSFEEQVLEHQLAPYQKALDEWMIKGPKIVKLEDDNV